MTDRFCEIQIMTVEIIFGPEPHMNNENLNLSHLYNYQESADKRHMQLNVITQGTFSPHRLTFAKIRLSCVWVYITSLPVLC